MPAKTEKQAVTARIAGAIKKGLQKPKAGEASAEMAKMPMKSLKKFQHTKGEKKTRKEDYDPTKMYVVLRPVDNLDAAGLIKELNPLQGLAPLNVNMEDVIGVTADSTQAQEIAAEAYDKYCKEVQALEEKKGQVGDKLKKTIDHLEKKRKEHVDMAKEDPKNASQHKEHIAKLASQIDDLMSKMEKIEKSKKNVEKVEDEKNDKKKDRLKEEFNPTDKVVFDIPLFIRLLEYAREDAKSDMDLHNVAQKAIELSQSGMSLSMKDYESLVGGQEQIAEADNVVDSIPEIQRYLKDLVIKLPKVKGIDTNEVKGIVELINSILAKLGKGSVGPAINATNKVFNQRTQGLK